MKLPRSVIAMVWPSFAEEMGRRKWTHIDTSEMPADMLRLAHGEVEHRDWAAGLAVDAPTEADRAPVIRGHAAVFGSMSEDLGGFREQIAPGAFKKTIGDNPDVRALVNHDPNYVLGRTRAGTLRLAEDNTGLAIEIDSPPTTWARDLEVSMRRGDVDQMSFGFRAIRDSWTEDAAGPVRTLREVALVDVSVVTFPAYTSTAAAVRALRAAGLDMAGLFPLQDVTGPVQLPTAPSALEQELAPRTPDGDVRGLSVRQLRRRLEVAGIESRHSILEVGSEEAARAIAAQERADQDRSGDPRQG